jgi:hypothetical protein
MKHMAQRNVIALAAAVVLGAGLTACGGSSDSGDSGESSSGSYCDLLQSAKDQVDQTSDLTALTDDNFNSLVDQIHEVEAAAPDDIAADWKTIVDELEEFESILADAGVSFDDLQSIEAGTIPEGVDMQKLQESLTKLQTLDTTEVTAAQQRISDHAKSECDITLDDTTASTNSVD